jgi:uncharacterized membrane protein YbhN (UPF0104 family)
LCYQYISVLIGSFNQYILFRTFSNLSYKVFLLSYFKAFSIGLLLPGQFGDASINVFLKSEGLYYSQAFSAYLWDKYLTFALYLGIVLLFIGDILGQPNYVPFLLWLTLGLIFPFLVYMVLRFIGSRKSMKRENRFIRFSNNLLFELINFAKQHPFLLTINLTLTCLKLGFVIISYHAMLACLGYLLPVFKVGLAALASGIVAYIPISIQGLGTVETAALFSFRTLGVPAPDVLVCFLLLRTSIYVLATVAYVMTCFLDKRRKANEALPLQDVT